MASILKVDKLDPQSGTALEIGTSGDTITVPSGATLDISASTLTPPATMPASSGINFTALNATNLGSGTVPTARLGSGTASSSTVLYGDQTYKAEPGGGKINQLVVTNYASAQQTSTVIDGTTWYDLTGPTVTITPSAATSTIFITAEISLNQEGWATDRSGYIDFKRAISGGATTSRLIETALGSNKYAYYTANNLRVENTSPIGDGAINTYRNHSLAYLDSPNTTSAVTYSMEATTYSLTAGSSWFMTPASMNNPFFAWEILA